jgi:hypothetical protein
MSQENKDTIKLSELDLSSKQIKALKEVDIHDVKGFLEVDFDFIVEEVDGFGQKTVSDLTQKAESLVLARRKAEKTPTGGSEGATERIRLLKKLAEIRNSVDYLQKVNKGDQFRFVSSSQAISSIRQKMTELGILLLPQIDNERTGLTYLKDEKQSIITEIYYSYVWVDVETGHSITVPWYAQGVDYHEKGVGKALTYGEKYFILKFFQIPTDKDDPDAFQNQVEKQNKKVDDKKDFKKKRQIFASIKEIEGEKEVSKDNIGAVIKKHTKLELKPDNFDEIIDRLKVIDEEKNGEEPKGKAEEKLDNAQKKASDMEEALEGDKD